MGSPRYEREIRSLLEGLDDFLPDEPGRRRGIRPSRGGKAPEGRHGPDPIQAVLPGAVVWMLRYPFYAAVLLIVVGRFLLAPLPEVGQVAALCCTIAAAALVILVVIRGFKRVRYGAPYERVWRGEVIDGPPNRVGRMIARWLNRFGGRR